MVCCGERVNLCATPCTLYRYDANTTVKFRRGRINYVNASRTAWKSDRSKMECRVVWRNKRFENKTIKMDMDRVRIGETRPRVFRV